MDQIWLVVRNVEVQEDCRGGGEQKQGRDHPQQELMDTEATSWPSGRPHVLLLLGRGLSGNKGHPGAAGGHWAGGELGEEFTAAASAGLALVWI